MNGVKYQKVNFEHHEHHSDADQTKDKMGNKDQEDLTHIEPKSDQSALVLLTNFKFLRNLGIVVFVFMFNVFSMYMISFMLKYLPGDKYLNLFILGVADFIPSLISGVVLALLPTKRGMIIMHILI